jgi:flavin-dependent dehydrogenase
MEIKIAGAGIAGLSAAITLKQLRKDIDISIRDNANSIREKIPRGVNALRNYSGETDIQKQYHDLGFRLDPLHPIMRQIFLLSENKFFEVESEDKPIFYSTTRGTKSSIDNMLLRQATKLEINIQWNSTYKRKKTDIFATGAKYTHCIGYGQHFIDIEETNTIFVLQNSKFCPYGYMCVIPYSKNEATIILGNFNPNNRSKLKQDYKRALQKIPQFQEYIQGATIKHELHGIGNFGLPSSTVNGTTLFVGERAGLLEAFRGFGIHNAILSGYAAGFSLANGSNYNNLWRKLLYKSLERGLLRRIAENEMNLSSERILNELYDRIPNHVSWEIFRAELKVIEKEFLETLDLPVLMKSLNEWINKFPFTTDSLNF